jgi:anti-sigma factor RsiW
MLSCRDLTELVTEYLEGALPLRDRLRFQLHLGMCTHCRAYLRQMRQTISVLGRLPDEPIPDAVRAELLRRFRGWKR